MAKRKHIPLAEKLAASLACLLPQDARDNLRAKRVSAKQVISLFEFHHIVFHAIDGSDKWHNLHPMQKAQHRERSGKDTSTIIHIGRLEENWKQFTANMTKKRKKKPPSRWPKKSFQPRRQR